MSKAEFRNVVDSLAKRYADEYIRNAVDALDETTRNDEDAFHEALCEIERCLKSEMHDFIREAEAEARLKLGI